MLLDNETIAVGWNQESWAMYDRKEAERLIIHKSAKQAKEKTSSDGHTLDDCFRKFTATETLTKVTHFA
jgi:hypothetical protein